MKTVLSILVSLLIVAAMGCSGNDKDRATQPTGSMPSFANSSAGSSGAGVASGDQKDDATPASSGGSSLAASTPYSQGKTAVSQNLNAAPFLVASQSQGATQKQVSSTGLVSRADGDMYGPTDLPAGGVVPGGVSAGAANQSPSAGQGKAGPSAPVKPAANQAKGK